MRVLITGAGGFVGKNLIKSLKNCEIIGIDKSPRYYLPKDVLFLKEDLNDIDSYSSFLNEVDLVFHLAASADIRRTGLDPWWDFKDNVKATISLLEYMRKKDVKEIKFVSSSAVYGIQEGVLNEDSKFQPISLYGASKVSCEAYLYAYSEYYGIKTTVFRPSQIVGPYQHRGVIVDFFHKLMKTPNKLEILGNGKQEKSYFFISDCIKALLELKNGIYNLANKHSVSVKELADIMISELGLSPEIVFSGGDRGWAGDTPYYHLSIDRALNVGWEPKYDNEESIRKTVRWLIDNSSYPRQE